MNNSRDYRRQSDNDYRSPSGHNETKTLTINSLNSSPQDNLHTREEHKRSNSPINRSRRHQDQDDTLDLDVSNDRNFMGRPIGQEPDAYDHYQSLRYGDGTLDEVTSPNFKGQIVLTQTSGFNNGTNTSELVDSVMRSAEENYTDGEYEESEFEDSEEEEQSYRGYMRRTDGSTEENHSLADRTPSQYAANVSRIKNSIGDRTQDRGQYTDSRYDDLESEEEESDLYIESQISGIDSLSQTHKSKVSSKKFKRSDRFNRNSKSRLTGNFAQPKTNSSQYNDTDSYRHHNDGTDSIGIKTKHDRNDDTLSCAPSNESWGAATPREPLVAPRTLKEKDQEEFRFFQSPNGKSLVIDESMRQDRIGQKTSQGTDINYTGSNLYENSDNFNPKTEERHKRMSKKLKKVKKARERNKKNSINKITGDLPRDQELEHALSDKFYDSKNHINLNEKDFVNESENGERKLEEVELLEYRKLAFEHRNLRAKYVQLDFDYKITNKQYQRYEQQVLELNERLNDEESKNNQLIDKLHLVNDLNNGASEVKIKNVNTEKLKKARQETQILKDEINQLELENNHLRISKETRVEMEQHYMSQIKELNMI